MTQPDWKDFENYNSPSGSLDPNANVAPLPQRDPENSYYPPIDRRSYTPDPSLGNVFDGGQSRLPMTREVPKKTLHWYQWVTYTVVLITCVLLWFVAYDAYSFIHHVQDALQQFKDSLTPTNLFGN
jgi:hypothetical protein